MEKYFNMHTFNIEHYRCKCKEQIFGQSWVERQALQLKESILVKISSLNKFIPNNLETPTSSLRHFERAGLIVSHNSFYKYFYKQSWFGYYLNTGEPRKLMKMTLVGLNSTIASMSTLLLKQVSDGWLSQIYAGKHISSCT